MLLEMAVADAYAIAFEFVEHTTDRPNDLSQFYQHPTYQELIPGQYTDDTQRALANTHVLLGDDLQHFNPYTYASFLLSVYARDPREGYSRNFQKLLKENKTPLEFIAACRRTAASNGSLMGVAPLGYIRDIGHLKLAAAAQAISTHHPDTVVHAQLVALAAHYFIYGGQKVERRNLRYWLMNNADWLDYSETAHRWEALIDTFSEGKKTTMKASSISSYMVYAIEKFNTLTEIILDAVERGGDTDSAAAVTVAVASCCPEIKNDLPIHLINALEPGGVFGEVFLRLMDEKLQSRFLDK